MKLKYKSLILFLTSLFVFPVYALDDYYEEEDFSNSEYVETSESEQEKSKSVTESNKSEYDIEIYPYISVKYTSVKVKEENILIPDTN